ncbi:MAG: HAD hydrolase-like protein [Bacteroidota bacterium]|nr:HAD hydrolase-like protein [Bacteroidota bacterium]
MWLLLFDIDGTLLRLRREPVRRALQEALQLTLRCPIPTECLHDLAGKTDLQIFAEVAHRCGWSEPLILRQMPFFVRAYTWLHRRWVTPRDVYLLPGVQALLPALQTLPTTVLGVLTGNLKSVALWKLRQVGIAGFFQVGAFGSDHWERTQLVRIAWERAWGAGIAVEPRRTVLIGDSPRDVLCARAWGLSCIAVSAGPVEAEALRAYGAITVLPNFLDIGGFWRALHELYAQANHSY